MTNPVSSDKISTPFTAAKADSAGPRPQETAGGTEREARLPTAADSSDLERASARYAQTLPAESPITNAEQALASAAKLRERIGSDPQAILRAHGRITQVKTDAALRAP